MSAPVRIEAEAWGDLRFKTLARILGLADGDHALIKCGRLWSWQAEHYTPAAPTYVVDADTIDSALEVAGAAEAMVRAKLADAVPEGYRIRGAKGRIEWLWQRREAAKAGGEARKRKAGDKDKPSGLPDGNPDAKPNPSPLVLVLSGEDLSPTRDPALPSPAPAPQESQPIPPEPPKTPDPEHGIRTPERDPEPEKPIPQPEQPTARTLLAELEQARQEAARELAVEVLPLPFGDVGERDLAERLAAARSQGPATADLVVRQIRHAIAMAKLETVRGEKSIEWFTGAVFAERNFRRLVAKTATPTTRAGPQSSAGRAPQQRIRPKVSDEIPPD